MIIRDRRRTRRRPIPTGFRRVREAAAIMQTSPSTIYRWIRDEAVRYTTRNNLLYVCIEEIHTHRQTNKRGTSTIPTPPPAGLHSTRDAAAATGVGLRTIQQWAQSGRIRAQRHGTKLWYVDLEDVERLAETMKPGKQA